MLTAFCCSSQISLQPNGKGFYCTDTAGIREIARVLKELEFSRSELAIYDQILKASEREANAYHQLVERSDSLNNNLRSSNGELIAQNDQLRRDRWYYAGGGFAIAIILLLLL